MRKSFFASLSVVACIFGIAGVISGLMLSYLTTPVQASQETCPNSGGWDKVDPLSGLSYTYTVPSGKLVTEWCYKASTTVVYGVVNPPAGVVTVESTVLNPQENNYQNLSHASFKLIDDPLETETETPTETQTETVTETPTETQTETVTETPTETVTETVTETITKTVTKTKTKTVTEEITETPTQEFMPTYSKPEGTPNVLIPVTGEDKTSSPIGSVVFNIGLAFFGLALVFKALSR